MGQGPGFVHTPHAVMKTEYQVRHSYQDKTLYSRVVQLFARVFVLLIQVHVLKQKCSYKLI